MAELKLKDVRKQPRVDLQLENNMGVSKYMYETIAGGYDNYLPISSVCDAQCFFCSNEMNPFEILREKFRDMDDIKRGIALLSPTAPDVRIGDSLPGRISEGEGLLHPKIFEVLELIRKKCPHSVIQVTTNGTRLTEEMCQKLLPYLPMKFTISYQSHDKANWCKIFDSPERKFDVVSKCWALLRQYGFDAEANMTPMPSMVGYEDIENTIKFLSDYVNYLYIFAPGYSRLVPPEIRKSLEYDTDEMSNFFVDMRKKYSMDIDWPLDPVRPLDQSQFGSFFQLMLSTYNQNFKNPLWLFSEAAFGKGKKIVEDNLPLVPNNHYVTCVKNKTYGGNIVAAGLLQISDFDKAIENAKKRTNDIDLLLMPKAPFDRFGNDLTMGHHDAFAKHEIPYWII
tara:strand:+ start:76 stop:1263 length:1188 start_codon:yes stop_codon:yes gene_type:complete